ncbi:type II toxin-antitoxin system PemK/MazF family toxin [Bdellovibrionota bacterium FG-2]
MGMEVKRFDVLLINLDPTRGSEIKKTRPCLVISPDEINRFLRTLIVAPMTTKGRDYPTRIVCSFRDQDGQIVLDQLRTIDRDRIVKKLGSIDTKTQRQVISILGELFAG